MSDPSERCDGGGASDARRTRLLSGVLLAVVVVGLAPLATSVVLGGHAAATSVDSADRAGAEAVDGDDWTMPVARYEGLAVVRDDGETTYLFAGDPHELVVTYRAAAVEETTVEVYLEATPVEGRAGENDSGDDVEPVRECSFQRPVEGATDHTERFDFEAWGGEWVGETNVTVEVRADTQRDEVVVAERHLRVEVLDPDADRSGSGLTNAEELRHGTDFLRSDTDGDGITDGEEIETYGTDPLSRDTDDNGVPDGIEILIGTDPTNPWTPHVYVFGAALAVGVAAAGASLAVTRRPFDAAGGESIRDRLAGDGSWWIETGDAATGERPGDAASVVSDRDRVLRLLSEHGGRMKQGAIVAETDWSKSKVSRLLSRMEDDGVVSRTRIGRENLVTRPGGDDAPGSETE